MSWTRRRFLSTLASAGPAAAAPLLAFERPSHEERPWIDAAQARFGDFPLAASVERFRRDQRGSRSRWRPPAFGPSGYVTLIDGIVRNFAGFQDARGAIIDPIERAERQYSTPAFALAAAVALRAGHGYPAMLRAAVRAMRAACADLADGRAADGHADFYTVLLMHADRELAGWSDPSDSAAWRRDLARVVPEKIYRRQPSDKTTNNWNLVAAAGEWMRTKAGLGDSRRWIEASLDRQAELFTPWGMYRDPNDPMAYDHFARLWAIDLIDEGYDGRHAAVLDALVRRGAWMSLLMQSPWGELPCGGRSAHHQWNEAQQAVTFESMAGRYLQGGDFSTAGAFKRAAHQSARSIGRWVLGSGELWIVKNRMEPGLRHGYESYSFHSQYNLLAAAMLAIAQRRSQRAGMSAQPSAADVGGFAFALQPAFHKVFANAGGLHVEIDTAADLHYNPTGILRIHHPAVPPETLSDGVIAAPSYQLPAKPARSLALGPEWRDRSGAWHALADHGRDDLEPAEFALVSASTSRVEFRLTYRGRLRGGAASIAEHVTVTPEYVDVEHRVDGDVESVRQCWPMLATDGVRPSVIAVAGQTARVTREGRGFTFEALIEGAAVSRLGVSEPCRNGFMDACVAEVPGRIVRSRIEALAKPRG
jgi:hypothetical protein